MEKTILNLLNKYHGNWEDIYTAVSRRENIDHHKLNFDLPNDLKNYFIGNKDYPDKFKDIAMPPFFVFWKGEIKLLDTQVLGFSATLSYEDYDLLISKSELFLHWTLCFKNIDLEKDKLSSLLLKGYKIILICNGGFNDLEFNNQLETNQILLISEFWDNEIYKAAEDQTLERIIFAVADALYISSGSNIIEKILFNYEHKKKTLFCHNNSKCDLDKLFIRDKSQIIYVENINDIN